MIIYHIFVGLHIIFAATWLVTFILSLFWVFRVWQAAKTPQEKIFMQRERKITNIGAHFGGVGILITGPVISSIGIKWGGFPFHLYPWLAVKQIAFIIILILVFFSAKKGIAFKKQIRGEGSEMISKQAREKWWSAYAISLTVYLLVVLNTVLGSVKPF
jgi:uncharacterized membrane protein